MAIFEKNKDKIGSKYTLKRTKCTALNFFFGGSMPPNPLAMRMASKRHVNSRIWKKILPPPPPLTNYWDAPESTYI